MSSRKKILVVDDSTTSRMFEQMVLARGPYQVVTAKDGAEAVEKAKAEGPDLILMDVIMPRMDGFEALRRIREDGQKMPIIMVTTRGESVNMEQGYKNGCTEYVTKPVDAIELLAKVKNCLGQ